MKTMLNNVSEERLRWIKPVLDKEITIKTLAKIAPFSERTIKGWLAAYRKSGSVGLENASRRPKSHPRETSIWIKERIVELRKSSGKCALKLKWDLEDEGIYVHERTVGKIIKQEGLIRKYRTRRIKYKYVKDQILPGWLLEMDVKYVPQKLHSRRYYQYTAIDVSSRWRYIRIYDGQSSYHSLCFLREVIKKFPYQIKAIKTDNHSTFTNRSTGYSKSADPMNPRLHALDCFCLKNEMEHYLIDPGKPAQNGTVERSHRSDQESFYDKNIFNSVNELRLKLRLWNMYYNDLRHCSLNGLTPNQVLASYLRGQYVRA